MVLAPQTMSRITSARSTQSMPPMGPGSRARSSFIAALREVADPSRAAGREFDSDISPEQCRKEPPPFDARFAPN
jgi:hypothetical protein